MALIKCSECGKEISDKTIVCPHCGNPIADKQSEENNVVQNENITKTDKVNFKILEEFLMLWILDNYYLDCQLNRCV